MSKVIFLKKLSMCQYIKVSIKHVNVRGVGEGGGGGSCFEFDQNTIRMMDQRRCNKRK